jgi:chitodextrinase
VGAAVSVAILACGSTASAQFRDRTPPTQPTNLRVIATTSYTVTLAWNPSKDKSGQFSYVICCANTSSQTVAQTETSAVYTAGLEAGRSFTLRIYAVDAAGNYSKPSNDVSFALPADTIPPGQPALSANDIGPTHATLAWSSSDDGPHVWYWLYMNGSLLRSGTRDGSEMIAPLAPETTYTFTVRARDFGGNWSEFSEPLTVTTKAPNPDDHTAPTTPANLWGNGVGDGSTELHLAWEQSTDDFDPQWIIRYNVYVNGELADIVVGGGRSVIYGVFGTNTITVEAVDSAGNTSAPATVVIVI